MYASEAQMYADISKKDDFGVLCHNDLIRSQTHLCPFFDQIDY
jgi:hypothetical protein